MHFAIVNVHGGEIELCFFSETGRKGESHRVDFLFSFFKLENREAVVGILRDLIPCSLGEAELWIESGEVFGTWDKGGDKGAHVDDFEHLRFGFERSGCRAGSLWMWLWKSFFQVGEKTIVFLQVDKFDCAFSCGSNHWKRKNHRDLFGSIETHLVGDRLTFFRNEAGENFRFGDRVYSSRKTTHGARLSLPWSEGKEDSRGFRI